MTEIPLPPSIKIGGHSYAIVITDEGTRELTAKECYGDSSSMLKRIRICNNLVPSQLTSTFIHECMHAISDVFGDPEKAVSEYHAKLLANGLQQVFDQLGITFVVSGK